MENGVDYSIPGFRVAPPDPETGDVVVRADRRMHAWVRRDRDFDARLHSPDFTTILYRDRAYWVDEETRAGATWTYRLIPADPAEIPRRVFRLSAGDLARERLELEIEAAEERRRRIASRYDFALGWPPVRVQRKMGERIELDPYSASRHNALAFAIVGGIVFVVQIVYNIRAAMDDAPLSLSPLPLLLALDGWARTFHLAHSDRPCGFFLLQLLEEIAVAAPGALRSERSGDPKS